MVPGRRVALAALIAVGALGSLAASAAADQQIVTATVYSSSGTQQESLTLGALEANSNQCPQYTGPVPVQHGQTGQTTTPNFTGGQVWALSTILSCLQPAVPSGAVKGVTIIQADGTPESGSGSQLTAADLAAGSSGFADPSEAPVIGNQGTASAVSIQYDRPWRGGNDNNFNDQVTQTSGSPLAIEVFEGPLLTVTPTASATTVPAGSTVSFSATYAPSNVSGVTYNWSFDGGAANSTASAPTVTFNTGGTYKVTVQVSDDEGGGGVACDSDHGHVVDPVAEQQQRADERTAQRGGKGGQVPRKHQRGNGGHGHNGSTNNGSTGRHHSTTPTSASHGGTTPAGSGGSGTTTPARGRRLPRQRRRPRPTALTPKSRVRHADIPPESCTAARTGCSGTGRHRTAGQRRDAPSGRREPTRARRGGRRGDLSGRAHPLERIARRPDRRGARGYRSARPRCTPRAARKARLADTALR